MASMLRDVRGELNQVNADALKSEIRRALINQKVNACPIAMRIAWHASGTYDKNDGTGGCNGATMRFEPEKSDDANAGLSIIRGLLHSVKEAHPDVSLADLWAYAGCVAIEFLGGPEIKFNFGRTDDADGARCPMNGRLPDAVQGADHLRCVFGRMGFNDQEIVALSGAHTLGRCHLARSGFDGPWTSKPLVFDNEYYRNLVGKTWRRKEWDGPPQFEDEETQSLLMLNTDMALMTDDVFRPHVERYAADQDVWLAEFGEAYAKLLSLGCPAHCQPDAPKAEPSERSVKSAHFRELAMHGSVGPARALKEEVDVNELESTSGRSALHKAAFWGHNAMVEFLLGDCGVAFDVQDYAGDTALHDAARFGHAEVARQLIAAGADASIANGEGRNALAQAEHYGNADVAALLSGGSKL